MITRSKLLRIEKGIDIWKLNKGVGTLEYVPRFGKSFVGSYVSKRFNDYRPTDTIHILTPNPFLKIHWENIVEKYNLINTTVYTANEYKIEFIKTPKLLIIDEIHRFVTGQKYDELLKFKQFIPFILGLTGTYPARPEDKEKLDKIAPKIDEITESEALVNSWISNYEEYNYLIKMNEFDSHSYSNYTKFISETFEQFKDTARLLNNVKIKSGIKFYFASDFNVIIACYVGVKLSNGDYLKPVDVRYILASAKSWSKDNDVSNPYYNNINKYWSPDNIYERVKKFRNFIKDRNDVINNNQIKLAATLNILRHLPNKNTIIFTESVQLANNIYNSLITNFPDRKPIIYHSAIKKQPFIDYKTGDYIRKKDGSIREVGKTIIKRLAIQGLKENGYDILIAVKSLSEGLDVPNLNLVLILGGTLNPIEQTQRSARVKTINYDDLNKNSIIINVVFEDILYKGDIYKSRDKKKLVERQKSNRNDIKWIISTTQIEL